VARWTWPFVAALVGALLLIVYVPELSLWLPRVLGVR
jgi:TRAP-type C4-dicarboxylate transport system permease large subunit